MHGVINLLKPPGMTSHDAVAFVRRALKLKRVGHTGTLDPAAAGVLPVCVGQATRLVEYLQAGRKTYIAEATFGFETDTLDAVGQTIKEGDATCVTVETIRLALDNFRGEIAQIPPAFSAIKKDGQKLYDLARAGQINESELTPRRVTIHKVHPTHFFEHEKRPRAMIHIECSSGTYIRSLVRDLGRALGCGATMTFLVRTRSGFFNLNNAVTLEEIAENPQNALIPVVKLLSDLEMPQTVNDAAAHDFSQGKRVMATNLIFERQIKGRMIAVKPQNAATFPFGIVQNAAGSTVVIAVPDKKTDEAQKDLWYKAEKVLFLNANA